MMEELREKIVKDVNEANLPLDCVYYLFKDLFRDLETEYSNYIQQMKIQKQKKDEESKNNSKPKLQLIKNEEKGE